MVSATHWTQNSKMRDPSLRRARDFGLIDDPQVTGPQNAITDVPGVRVGHTTCREGNIATGFTAILPHEGNMFRERLLAAVEVINGFGKSAGLMQVTEMGCIETPILLTNTFGIGTGFNALVREAIRSNPDIGRDVATVNPVVCECNDGYLNDIQAMALTEADATNALNAARAPAGTGPVAQGSVGAGTGMSCFGFKGGIGTASRVVVIEGRPFILGTLVLANFGKAGDLILPDGRRPKPFGAEPGPEKGSVIVILATDIPLTTRQLRRVAKRCGAGIAWLGSFWGNGSGDIVLAFSTAMAVPRRSLLTFSPGLFLCDCEIDAIFRAAAEATREAVLNALCAAPSMTGFQDHTRPSLADWLLTNPRKAC